MYSGFETFSASHLNGTLTLASQEHAGREPSPSGAEVKESVLLFMARRSNKKTESLTLHE